MRFSRFVFIGRLSRAHAGRRQRAGEEDSREPGWRAHVLLGILGTSSGPGGVRRSASRLKAPTTGSDSRSIHAYRWFDVKDDLPIGATRFAANHQTHQLDFNLVLNMTPPESRVRVYAAAGPGAYYRQVESRRTKAPASSAAGTSAAPTR